MKWFRAILLVFAGVYCILIGIYLPGKDTGRTVANKEYGGEAYTGIQNTEATTAYNVYVQSELIQEIGGCFLIVVGITLIAFAIPVKKINQPF